MKACSVVTTKKPKAPPVLILPGGLLGLVLTALEEQAVKPLAQIVGNYLRGNGLDKCRESFQGVHLLSAVRGMEKGRRNSIA